MSTPALQVADLSKSFGGTKALDGASLTVAPGEVHALLGQNGSGKSTLVKILTGVYTPDSGTASVFGKPLELPVAKSHEHGIAVIHQDIGFVDTLNVLDNLGAPTSYGARLFGVVNEKREEKIYREIMRSLDLEVPLHASLTSLSPAEKAMLAVVRAIRLMREHNGNQLFILDEPTAALSKVESEQVLRLMRTVADTGSSVVFISHRLNEVKQGCDRLTVMRDGATVFQASVADVSRDDIIENMLGRSLNGLFPSPPAITAPTIQLEVTGLTGDTVEGFSLNLRAGEIVGVTGLAGMGQEEVAQLLSGSVPARYGRVALAGDPISLSSPRQAIDAGICFVPGDRLGSGCWAAGTARENVTLPVIRGLTGAFGLSKRKERSLSSNLLGEVGLRPLIPEQVMTGFSGGNQQKIVMAKWLQIQPRVLILEEPTQGVDAGAARELLDRVVETARLGTGVIVVSGDHEQLVEICHRVIVMSHGRIVDELSGDQLSELKLLAACSAG